MIRKRSSRGKAGLRRTKGLTAKLGKERITARRPASILFGLLAVGLCVGLYCSPLHDPLDLPIRDLLFHLREPIPTSGRIIHIDIDDKSVDEIGRWPWDRREHAAMLQTLMDCGAAAVLFDVEFVEQIREDPGEDLIFQHALRCVSSRMPVFVGYTVFEASEVEAKDPRQAPWFESFREVLQEDPLRDEKELVARMRPEFRSEVQARFVAARERVFQDFIQQRLAEPLERIATWVEKAVGAKAPNRDKMMFLIAHPFLSHPGRQVDQLLVSAWLGVSVDNTDDGHRHWCRQAEKESLLWLAGLSVKAKSPVRLRHGLQGVPSASGLLPPAIEVAEAATGFGWVNSTRDSDGKLRHSLAMYRIAGRLHPQLALSAAFHPRLLEVDPASMEFVPGERFCFEVRNAGWLRGSARVTLPLNEQGAFLVNWPGSPGEHYAKTFPHIPCAAIRPLWNRWKRFLGDRSLHEGKLLATLASFVLKREQAAGQEVAWGESIRHASSSLNTTILGIGGLDVDESIEQLEGELKSLRAEKRELREVLIVKAYAGRGGLSPADVPRLRQTYRVKTQNLRDREVTLRHLHAFKELLEWENMWSLKHLYLAFPLLMEKLPPDEELFPYLRRAKPQLQQAWDATREDVRELRALQEQIRKRVGGKICIIGSTETSSTDLHATPLGSAVPGVLTHSAILNMIFTGATLRELPARQGLLLILVLGLLSVAALYLSGPRLGAALTLTLMTCAIGGAWLLFTRASVVVPLLEPVVLPLLVFSAISGYRYAFEARAKAELRELFQDLVSPELVTSILRERHKISLGGETREASVVFTDLQNFTTFSESLPPREVVDLLNSFFTRVADVMMARAGYINKYLGDGLMVIFGAPLTNQRHATDACLSCLHAMEELEQFNRQLRERFEPQGASKPLVMRIGISTGVMVVGFMGHERKKEYTAMGDTVNVGSRLEGANKEFGTGILISAKTYQIARESIVARPIGNIQVKGRVQPVRCYELLAREGGLDEARTQFLEVYRKAFDAHEAGDRKAATQLLREVLQLYPEDAPTRRLLQECEAPGRR